MVCQTYVSTPSHPETSLIHEKQNKFYVKVFKVHDTMATRAKGGTHSSSNQFKMVVKWCTCTNCLGSETVHINQKDGNTKFTSSSQHY